VIPFDLRAIGAGTLVAAVGGLLLGALYFVFLFSMFAARSTPADTVTLDTSDFVGIELLGLLSTLAGGFVAARMARRAPVQHGAIVGAASLAIWLLVDISSPGEATGTWSNVAGYLAEIPAGALGGYLACRAEKRLQPETGAGATRR
jgi:putative membrane protein (TIGR04086 family)